MPARGALAGSKAAKELLRLRKRESILAILLLGRSAVQFQNKVAGKAMPTQWIDPAGDVRPLLTT